MTQSFDALMKKAMNLPPKERLRLIQLLPDRMREGQEKEWDLELSERIRAIDEGIEVGIAYEEVRRAVREHLRV